MSKKKVLWLLTCEHASPYIPPKLQPLFDHEAALRRIQSHEGYDKGALSYAKILSRELRAPLYVGKWSRLVIELNRSLHHPRLFSSLVDRLSDEEKNHLIESLYLPFRKRIHRWITRQLQQSEQNTVIHVSCHTFTPYFRRIRRKTLLGLLYDPRRKLEKYVAAEIQRVMQRYIGKDKVHCNKPYKGISDGHVTSLRKDFESERYVGIELEFSSSCCDVPLHMIFRRVWMPQLVYALRSVQKEVEATHKLCCL